MLKPLVRSTLGAAMFRVLHSSAGAGKTHTLVKNYLLLALGNSDPAAYTHILALTFTNKAAAEMRERVLLYLEALASGDPLRGAQADMRKALLALPGLSPEALQQRAQAMLGHVLHHWPQLAINTIDAFTRRVVTPFARDLGLEQDMNMTTEEEYFRDKAVDLLLEEAGSDPALTQVLVRVCEQLLEEERPWRADQPLRELSKQLGKEQALEHLALLRQLDSTQFLEIHQRLQQRTQAFANRMRTMGRNMLAAIANAGLTDQDLAYGSNGFISYFRKLSDFGTLFTPGANVTKTLNSGTWHQQKASAQAKAAVEALVPEFKQTIREVEALRNTEMRQYFLELAVLKDLMPTATLNSIDQRLEALKHDEGLTFFSDLTRKVMQVVQEEPAPFLFERLGERYLHFLVDEFQDTSLMQWHTLLPLVENALSSGGSILLVGDAKQAIYRWRNGEARQFTGFPGIFGKEKLARGPELEAKLQSAYVEVEPLGSNYRSARNIIQFNNDVTNALKQELGVGEQPMYHRHEQQLVRPEEGYVEVASCATEKGEANTKPWELMVKAVQDCLEDGFRLGDIAVLVRSKAQSITAARWLALNNWNVVSPTGLELGGNPAVTAVVNVLAWLHRPADEHAALAAQSIASILAGTETIDPFSANGSPQEYMRRWHADHPRINRRLPLLALACRISRALHHDPADDAFVMALVNEVRSFTRLGSDDLGGFLEQWERTIRMRPVTGNIGRDTIQVMTIHKAKGLQFPVVIVPEAGKRTGGNKPEHVWIAPQPPIGELRSALVESSKQNMELGIAELEEEKNLRQLDDLDVLYVALTRPEERLYLSVHASGSEFPAKPLREHLKLEAGATWSLGKREPYHPAEKNEATGNKLCTSSAGEEAGYRDLAIREEAPTGWDPADPDPFRSHGRMIHAILARVRTARDLPAAITAEARAQGVEAEALATIGSHLTALLAKPALQPFFREGLEVYTETTLLDGLGHAHRPDRMVRDGACFRVLDIKTGAPSEHHLTQVKGYMQLLHDVEGSPVEGYLLYARDGELVAVTV